MKGAFVGTSGWIYKGWAGTFYPPNVKKTGELEYYATRFNTVEINATFYRLPLPGTVKGWHGRSPVGFLFAVKGSRFITQMKKLNVERKSIQVFFHRAKLLKEKCGPILWQLPPSFGFNGAPGSFLEDCAEELSPCRGVPAPVVVRTRRDV